MAGNEVPSIGEVQQQMEQSLSEDIVEVRKILISKEDEDEYVKKTLEPARVRKFEVLAKIEDPKLKAKAEARFNAVLSNMELRLRQNISETRERIEKEKAAAARSVFIETLASNIADEAGHHCFVAALEGLLGDERDPEVWQQLYAKHFAWTPEQLTYFTPDFLDDDQSAAKELAEGTALYQTISEDPEVASYISGLIRRVDDLYGPTAEPAENRDSSFVTEYKEYLQLRLNSFGNIDYISILSLQAHIRSPEDYRKKGFLNLPERPKGALTGSQFFKDVLGVDPEDFKKNNGRVLGTLDRFERQNAILEQIELGNVPDFLRRPKEVHITGPDGTDIKTYVMPDYIAIGTDSDYVRVPMSPVLAQALARRYGLSLPTKTVVEEVYSEAGRSGKQVIGPSYSQPDQIEQNSAYLDSAGFYMRSSSDINAQLDGVKPGTLVAGGKKELVIDPWVATRVKGVKPDESIGFYGLFDSAGLPIQRSPGHGGEAGYMHTEYALGVRFMSPMIVVTDKKTGKQKVMKWDDALQDPTLAKTLNRLERTDHDPKRSNLPQGTFNPDTVYAQNEKRFRKVRGPRAV